MKSALVRFLPLLLIALLWEIAPRVGLVSSLALPPLSAVLSAWVELLRDGDLLTNGASSLYRASAGLATARAIAIEDISNVVRTMAYSQPVLLPDLGNRADFFKQPS